MITGKALAEYREAKGVDARALAAALDRSLAPIEATETVGAEVAAAYINAVEALAAPREGRPVRKLELRVGLYIDGDGPYRGEPDSPLVHRLGGERRPW